MRLKILALVAAALLAFGQAGSAYADSNGANGFEGQPGNQGNGLQGYEGQPGNQGG
jgi:hypothetical protein